MQTDWAEYEPEQPFETAETAEMDPETRFHTELFGFDRVEVLSYIERISAANAEKARALEDTITALQRDLTGARQQGSALERKAGRVFQELQEQKKRAEDAVAQADALRAEVDRANDEIAAVRSRLFAREQENAALKSDNDRLNETVEDLTRALTKRGAPLPASGQEAAAGRAVQQAQQKAREILHAADEKAQEQLERARRDAAEIVSKARQQSGQPQDGHADSAGSIAADIAALKEQLAAVDAKILAATSDLQKATEGIAAALEAARPGAAEYARADSLLRSPAAQAAAEAQLYRDRLQRDEDAYYRALHQVRYEEALRDRIYAEDRLQQNARERVRQEEEKPGEPAQAQDAAEKKEGPAPRARTAAVPAALPAEQERPAQRKVAGDPPVTERWMQRQGAAAPGACGAAPVSADVPKRGAPAQQEKAPALQEQYDAVQYAGQTEFPDIPNVPTEPVVQKVDIPQVPAKQKPESDGQAIFGKPHAPRAMPFAPFDPYTPHTAPYIEPDADAARLLNTPPPPPPRGASAKKPYVPQPTPIAPSVSMSQPYVPPAATVLAGMPQAHAAAAPAPEPVIIPYSMPIPPLGDASPAAREETDAARRQERAVRMPSVRQQAQKSAAAERYRQDSALSDDLLAHLNHLLEDEKSR